MPTLSHFYAIMGVFTQGHFLAKYLLYSTSNNYYFMKRRLKKNVRLVKFFFKKKKISYRYFVYRLLKI
jgi:hypothetical protein